MKYMEIYSDMNASSLKYVMIEQLRLKYREVLISWREKHSIYKSHIFVSQNHDAVLLEFNLTMRTM